MEKPASTLFPVHDVIRRRWSPRAFASKPVAPEILGALLEAARWAPSSFGEEPWRYLIATQDTPEDFKRMLACLAEKNQEWARGAPVLMIGCAKLTFTRNGKVNRHAYHDLGQATAQLTLEAVSRGLFVHQMAGILPDKIRETYKIPGDFDPVTGIAIGYPGEPEQLPEAFREAERAPRKRRASRELFFEKSWGELSRLFPS
jgi:nitroreductase